ncbi:MAG: hypothetical protein Q4D38_05865 [Planctomycetia bacterium]|nr:hypothetical protein [Planctomycetia bacterium]
MAHSTTFQRRLSVFLCVLALWTLSGCGVLSPYWATPTNAPLRESDFLTPHRNNDPNTVTLDIFFVRCPYGCPELNETLWEDVDEQAVAPRLRRNLYSNGFRVGVIGNQLPLSLLRLLNARMDEKAESGITTIRLEDIPSTPKVMRSSVAARNNQRNEVNVSEITNHVTILFNENGVPGGESFTKAQAVLAVKTQTKGDGSVKVEIVPELQYGEPRQTYSYGAGAMMMATARPKKLFDSLRTEFRIKPGQIIVFTNVAELEGNLGHFFFSDEQSELRYQKLLCIRVIQSQHDELYSTDGRLPMDPAAVDSDAEDSDEAEE